MKKYFIALLFTMSAGLGMLSGCGAPNDCSEGQVKSNQYGCIPQGSCPSGQGQYNGQCVALNGGTSTGGCPMGYQYYNGQCIPQQGGYPTGGNCPAGTYFNGSQCIPQQGGTGNCPAGTYFNGSQCIPQQGGGYPPTGGYGCPNLCGYNMVRTSMGCLPQSQFCPPCTGAWGGFCYQ
jgi:hypothetical protein